MSDYVTSAALKKTLQLTGETYADDDVAAAISAASRAIDQACGRRFWLDAIDATRYYERASAVLVVIDDLATVTSIKTDPTGEGVFSEIWTENTDFVFGPQNAAADGVPYQTIYSLYAGSYVVPDGYTTSGKYFLPSGPRRIQVIGKFGWPAVPAQVVTATSILAARYLKRLREAPLGIAGFGMDGTAVRVPKVDPDVMALLDGLRRGKVGSNGFGIA